MVHEAMVLEYSGRHLALIELAASLKLLLYLSLIACLFVPWGIVPRRRRRRHCWRSASPPMSASSPSRGVAAGGVRDRRSPRCGCSACRNSSAPR